jgi:hypothetical protein
LAPYIYALIIVSIAIAGLAEVLISREKRQIKKQFTDEMDRLEKSRRDTERQADSGESQQKSGKDLQ